MNTARNLLLVCFACGCVPSAGVAETILFESGTLGPTGISREDVFNQVVPGANLNQSSFNGMRFEVDQSTNITRVGGHFVGPGNSGDSLFAAVVALADENDFPDSADLSTPDVLGNTVFLFPEPSALTYGDIDLLLNPGWYAVVFGSGLFEATGSGAALLNNSVVDNSNLIGFQRGFGWGNISPSAGMYFAVEGTVVPEPATWTLLFAVAILLLAYVQVRLFCVETR